MNKYQFVKKHPLNIAFFKDPPKSLQVVAVRGSYEALRYINDPHPDAWAQYFKSQKCRGAVGQWELESVLKRYPKHKESIIRGVVAYTEHRLSVNSIPWTKKLVKFFMQNQDLFTLDVNGFHKISAFMTEEEIYNFVLAQENRTLVITLPLKRRKEERVKKEVLRVLKEKPGLINNIDTPTEEEVKTYFLSSKWSYYDNPMKTVKNFKIINQENIDKWTLEIAETHPHKFWKRVDMGMDATDKALKVALPALLKEVKRVDRVHKKQRYVDTDCKNGRHRKGSPWFDEDVTENVIRFLFDHARDMIHEEMNVPHDIKIKLIEEDSSKLTWLTEEETKDPAMINMILEKFKTTKKLDDKIELAKMLIHRKEPETRMIDLVVETYNETKDNEIKFKLAAMMKNNENDDYRVIEMVVEHYPGMVNRYDILTKKMILEHLKEDYIAKILAGPNGRKMLQNMMTHMKEGDRKEMETASS
jgi:hypothetical protein